MGGESRPLVAVHAPRDRIRRVLRRHLQRRDARVTETRSVAALGNLLRASLVDLVVVDLASHAGDAAAALALAPQYPSAAFVAAGPVLAADGAALELCARANVVDVLADGMDGALLPVVLATHGFSARFAAALHEPPAALRLATALQRDAWRRIVARAGRPLDTQQLAAALHVSREHLSRSFASGPASRLKRVVDLVRLLAAAELAKNPGCDEHDVARILEYASTAQLSAVARRLAGTAASSLAALRAVDLVDRFVAVARRDGLALVRSGTL